MRSEPWKDWSPGVLCKNQIKDLYDSGYIEWEKEDTDGSSFDLHLTDEGYELLHGTIKPCGDRYHNILKNEKYAKKLDKDDQNTFTLVPKRSYIFKLRERLHFRKEHNIYGQATAKSSVGRVDVLARLIVDGMSSYEGFARGCISGDLYVEIIPASFKVKVKEGKSVSQLRLFYGEPSISIVKVNKKEDFNWLLSKDDDCPDSLCVDLSEINVNSRFASAFSSLNGEELTPIDLWKKNGRGRKA